MKWISVKDETPTNGYSSVLCATEGWDDMIFQLVLDYDFDYDEWSDHEGNIYKPTHWMPLPEPPKK